MAYFKRVGKNDSAGAINVRRGYAFNGCAGWLQLPGTPARRRHKTGRPGHPDDPVRAAARRAKPNARRGARYATRCPCRHFYQIGIMPEGVHAGMA